MRSLEMLTHQLTAQVLTATAFASFGDVIAAAPGRGTAINAGSAQRFDDQTELDVHAEGGMPCVTIFRTGEEAHCAPYHLRLFERHRLGSQTFVPLGQGRCLAVVTLGETAPDESAIQAFIVEPGQGITLRRGVWHHPLITLGGADVLVVERRAAEVDCEIVPVVGQFVVGLAE